MKISKIHAVLAALLLTTLTVSAKEVPTDVEVNNLCKSMKIHEGSGGYLHVNLFNYGDTMYWRAYRPTNAKTWQIGEYPAYKAWVKKVNGGFKVSVEIFFDGEAFFCPTLVNYDDVN